VTKNLRAVLKQRISELRGQRDATGDVRARADLTRAIELTEKRLEPGTSGRPREWPQERLLRLELDYLLETPRNPEARSVEVWKTLCKKERYKGLHWETLRRRKPRAKRHGEIARLIRPVRRSRHGTAKNSGW
jgi:hypothetical protein